MEKNKSNFLWGVVAFVTNLVAVAFIGPMQGRGSGYVFLGAFVLLFVEMVRFAALNNTTRTRASFRLHAGICLLVTGIYGLAVHGLFEYLWGIDVSVAGVELMPFVRIALTAGGVAALALGIGLAVKAYRERVIVGPRALIRELERANKEMIQRREYELGALAVQLAGSVAMLRNSKGADFSQTRRTVVVVRLNLEWELERIVPDPSVRKAMLVDAMNAIEEADIDAPPPAAA